MVQVSSSLLFSRGDREEGRGQADVSMMNGLQNYAKRYANVICISNWWKKSLEFSHEIIIIIIIYQTKTRDVPDGTGLLLVRHQGLISAPYRCSSVLTCVFVLLNLPLLSSLKSPTSQ